MIATLLALGEFSAPLQAETIFKPVPLQYIAALGDPKAMSGMGAQNWGLWRVDPGPRGVRLKDFEQLKSAGGVAPAQWIFDNKDWWLEENGLIMEKPDFPLPPGKYMVTGDREVTAVLTIHPKDNDGSLRWDLDKGATLYDVTHLPCRSARYSTASSGRRVFAIERRAEIFPCHARRRHARRRRVQQTRLRGFVCDWRHGRRLIAVIPSLSMAIIVHGARQRDMDHRGWRLSC